MTLVLIQVGRVVRNGYSVLSLDWPECFSSEGGKRKPELLLKCV